MSSIRREAGGQQHLLRITVPDCIWDNPDFHWALGEGRRGPPVRTRAGFRDQGLHRGRRTQRGAAYVRPVPDAGSALPAGLGPPGGRRSDRRAAGLVTTSPGMMWCVHRFRGRRRPGPPNVPGACLPGVGRSPGWTSSSLCGVSGAPSSGAS
jgi:hypothetical protein